jgi:general nucleoside transport system permease protein
VFGWLVIWLNTNQYATGLALSLFGAGLSAFAGIPYTQAKLPEQTAPFVPLLGDIPFLGPALFRHHFMVYLAIALMLGLVWFLYRTRAGLVLRSVGESPESAHALGYPVRRIRCWRSSRVALCAGWPGPTCPPCTRLCGSRA